MPFSPSVAARIADLLNAQNQLTVRYTPEMVLQHEDRYLICSGANSDLMGVVEAKRIQWYQCEIDHLSVHPEFTRQGIGSRLLKAAEDRAKQVGARVAQCTIRVGNTASEGLFKKHGYWPTTTFWNEQTGNRVTVYQKVLKTEVDPTPETECRAKIITDYASWTVLSALRSGAPIKSRKDVYPLLRTVDFGVLLQESTPPISIGQFDAWHEAATAGLCERRPDLCTGWAAKMLNVYLKTAVYAGGLGRSGLAAALHPPIDSGLWSGLRRRFRGHALLTKTHVVERIKDIRDYPTYQTIVAGCRLAAETLGCLSIEVEQLWEGVDSE
jgi:GNAT superfamily N-acetyltransferase